jgi:catechol 2,3-dioxygenase-like lactoylglutathione lyase family enzyme
MEGLISKLIADFENGRMTRRQLVQSLAIAAGAAATGQTVIASPGSSSFNAISLDHISYQVDDYRPVRDFYADLMGMKVDNDNGKTQAEMNFGNDGASVIVRNHFQRQGQPPAKGPLVDHIAYKIDNWDSDKVKAELERRGLKPREDTGAPNSGYASYHVIDPGGFDLQISGDPKPGDRLYKKKP